MHWVQALEKILYQYFAYGLSIHSDFEIREFPVRESQAADITIRLGDVAEELEGAEWFRSTWQAKLGHFQMDVPDVGRFLATNGNEMIVDRLPGASDQEIVIYTVGSMFAALLQQRDHLTLHASSIKGPDGAVIFVGSSGMGKSTLLSAMNARGYAMIADDITALKRNQDGLIEARPATPVTRLWEDSAHELDRKADEGWQVRSDMNKYNLPIENFYCDPIPVSHIFLLSNPGSGEMGVEAIAPSQKFMALKKFTYRKHFMAGMSMDVFLFKFVNDMIHSVPVDLLVRPHGNYELDKLAQLVESAVERGDKVSS